MQVEMVFGSNIYIKMISYILEIKLDYTFKLNCFKTAFLKLLTLFQRLIKGSTKKPFSDQISFGGTG